MRRLARIPLGLDHPRDKNMRRVNKVEQVLYETSDPMSHNGKGDPLFRYML
jgi:hypothetical protein